MLDKVEYLFELQDAFVVAPCSGNAFQVVMLTKNNTEKVVKLSNDCHLISGRMHPESIGAFLKYFGIPVALTWFMSQKTFDGKKPYSFLKSQITYALRPKITYAGKAVKLQKETFNETITAVRSVNYVPDKIY